MNRRLPIPRTTQCVNIQPKGLQCYNGGDLTLFSLGSDRGSACETRRNVRSVVRGRQQSGRRLRSQEPVERDTTRHGAHGLGAEAPRPLAVVQTQAGAAAACEQARCHQVARHEAAEAVEEPHSRHQGGGEPAGPAQLRAAHGVRATGH